MPISAMPTRWGLFTGHQLGWMGAGALPVYVLLRAHLAAAEALLAGSPWLLAASALAFGRCQGRALDAFLGDWARFQIQPKVLLHPELFRVPDSARFTPVDARHRSALPWTRP